MFVITNNVVLILYLASYNFKTLVAHLQIRIKQAYFVINVKITICIETLPYILFNDVLNLTLLFCLKMLDEMENAKLNDSCTILNIVLVLV